ncbi:MAG: LytTR family DNA-binding domain-containing protein, partial [Pseudomonadota bacterium]
LTLRSEDRSVPALLAGMAGLVMLQLFFEASRGLFAYLYPVQDLRLIGILACSVGFGLALVAVVARQFWSKRSWHALVMTMIGMVTVFSLTPSMDARTAMMLLLGSASALILALIGWRRGRVHAWAYAAALALFLIANFTEPSAFIDHAFYLLTALFLVVLMVLQAMAYSRERQGQIEQRLRADQLQRVLDQAAAEREPLVLSVPGTGTVQSVPISDVVRVQGAGDYVELHLGDGREVLHSATLNELDAELPSHFLRVHRSHLVNTCWIERLVRNESGTGTLHLSNGQTVPVSRRIMPGVRRALR